MLPSILIYHDDNFWNRLKTWRWVNNYFRVVPNNGKADKKVRSPIPRDVNIFEFFLPARQTRNPPRNLRIFQETRVDLSDS